MSVAPASSFSAALAVQREMALRNAMIAQRTPIVLDADGDDDADVVINLSPGAIFLLGGFGLGFGFIDDDDDILEAFLIAELLETLVAVDVVV
jgi:hypothetical protein